MVLTGAERFGGKADAPYALEGCNQPIRGLVRVRMRMSLFFPFCSWSNVTRYLPESVSLTVHYYPYYYY